MSNVCFRRKEIRVLLFSLRLSVLVFMVVFVLDRASRGLQGYQASVGNQDHRFVYNNLEYIKMLKCGHNYFHLKDLFSILGNTLMSYATES